MSYPGARHRTDSAALPTAEDVSQIGSGTSGGNEVGDVSEQYQTREDLEKALRESKRTEAQLRKMIDSIPAKAWCALPAGTSEFSNHRRQSYTGSRVRRLRQFQRHPLGS